MTKCLRFRIWCAGKLFRLASIVLATPFNFEFKMAKITESSGNVYADTEHPDQEGMLAKSDIARDIQGIMEENVARDIQGIMEENDFTEEQAAGVMCTYLYSLVDILRGRFSDVPIHVLKSMRLHLKEGQKEEEHEG